MTPWSPLQAHERLCSLCRAREWCQVAMDLIAKDRGYLSWDLWMAATDQERSP